MPFSQSVLTKGLIPIEISDTVAATVSVPSNYPIKVAFKNPGVLPTSEDWVPAVWAPGGDGQYVAQILVGPSDGNPPVTSVTLAVGTYVVWAQITITDNAGQPQEVQVFPTDTVTIGGANSTVAVVSIQDMVTYMGYPFDPVEQYPAVRMVLDDLTNEVELWLNADLSIQQYTENYMIPFEGTTILNGTVFNTAMLDVYMSLDQLNLSYSSGFVRLKHWPIVSYESLYIVNNYSTPPEYFPVPPPTPPESLPMFVFGTTVQVTYTAGYDGSSMPNVRSVIMRAAARELTNRLDDAVGLKGGLATERLPDGPGPAQTLPGLTQPELMRLSRYKRRTVV